jgi:sorting and assembly machinery component 37
VRIAVNSGSERLLTDLLHSFSSFLESRGQPLLDLSLYVSSENYTEWTSPALAQILQWPQQWITPHGLRDEAKVRSEHLGLSSLDLESFSKEEGDTNARAVGNIPKSLLANQKETVASAIGKGGHQNRFRLDAVTSDLFEPLCDFVERNGSHSWVFGTDQASSLDCLLLAYMSLMSPPLKPPHRWLPDALSTRYPALLEWTTNFRQERFGGPISTADVLSLPASDMPASHRHLPWHPQAPNSVKDIGLTVLSAMFDSLPIVSKYRSDRIVRQSSHDATADNTRAHQAIQASKYPLYSRLGAVGSALGAGLGYLFYTGLLGKGGRTQQARHLHRIRNTTIQRDFGEAGRMLGLGAM